MTLVVIDTNMFLSCFELRIDILSQLREQYGANSICTLDCVIDELKKEDKKYAFALKLAQSVLVHHYEGQAQTVDDAILDFAREKNAIIASQDAELVKKAKNKHLKTIGIRQNKYLI